MKTFLEPLSSTEEALFLRLLKEGSKQERKVAKDTLIEHNLRLVAHIAKKYQNTDEELEDLLSVGTLGLMKAINSFDASKGSRLATYAARCIENELLMLLRFKKKNAKDISLQEAVGTDHEGNEICLIDVIPFDDEDVVDRMYQKQQLSKIAEIFDEELGPREKQVISMRYGLSGAKELTQSEVGAYLGISRSYVSRIEKRALHKLQTRLTNA